MNHVVLKPEEVMKISPVIPVIAIEDASEVVNLANALVAGGIRILEVTLRTPAAIDVIRILANEVPDAIVGAGTVLNIHDLERVQDAGAKFAISPGSTKPLLSEAMQQGFTLLPGVATASEIMQGMDLGYTHFKLFPAVTAGGVGALKSFAGPFQKACFCPTGGISEANFLDFLALDNVLCVGGTWVASPALIKEKNYQKITALSAAAIKLVIEHSPS